MKKTILVMTLIAAMFIPGLIFAQGNTNLLKNSELNIDAKGKITAWYFTNFSQDKGYKGKNSVCISFLKRDKPGVQAVMAQYVKNLKPGKYMFTAYFKLDRKIKRILICRIIKLDGKYVYQKKVLTASEQPKPGEWTKVITEFDIPEGTTGANFAFDLRDSTAGATVWIDSPVLYYKSEQ